MAKPDGCGLDRNKVKKKERKKESSNAKSDGRKPCVSIYIYKSMSKVPCLSILKLANAIHTHTHTHTHTYIYVMCVCVCVAQSLIVSHVLRPHGL